MGAEHETTFTVSSANLVIGRGASKEVGFHATQLGMRRALLVTDAGVARAGISTVVADALEHAGVEVRVYSQVEIEPSDASFAEAAGAAEGCDGFVAVGGGSTMDTAKAANLYSCYPAPFLTYVNRPIGQGATIPGDLRPLIAIPTTAGTGSETTGVAICDIRDLHAKSGIADRKLRPTLAIVDPLNTADLPPFVTAASGFDVLCHALESFTALPYAKRPAPATPVERPAYQGANPVSDVWAERTLEMVGQSFPRVLANPADLEARESMMLAATYAGIGFGNAGVHLAHGMSYAISGMVRDYVAPDYPPNKPLVPHGISVALAAPSVFRFTASANPARHLRAAALLGADTAGVADNDVGELLASWLLRLMKRAGVPTDLAEVGYSAEDIPALVEATLPQRRVLNLSPCEVDAATLGDLFREAMRR